VWEVADKTLVVVKNCGFPLPPMFHLRHPLPATEFLNVFQQYNETVKRKQKIHNLKLKVVVSEKKNYKPKAVPGTDTCKHRDQAKTEKVPKPCLDDCKKAPQYKVKMVNWLYESGQPPT